MNALGRWWWWWRAVLVVLAIFRRRQTSSACFDRRGLGSAEISGNCQCSIKDVNHLLVVHSGGAGCSSLPPAWGEKQKHRHGTGSWLLRLRTSQQHHALVILEAGCGVERRCGWCVRLRHGAFLTCFQRFRWRKVRCVSSQRQMRGNLLVSFMRAAGASLLAFVSRHLSWLMSRFVPLMTGGVSGAGASTYAGFALEYVITIAKVRTYFLKCHKALPWRPSLDC